MRHLLRRLRGHLFLIWDNLGLHRGERVRLLRRRVPRLHLEYLPAYAPELNPDDGIWRQTQQHLVNGAPTDLSALALSLITEFEALRRSPARLWRCITKAGLTP